MAAGFTVVNSKLDELENRLREIAARVLASVELAQTLPIDAEASLDEMNWDLQKAIEQLAPFGYGNREPVFLSREVTVRDARLVGNEHLKLVLVDGSVAWDAIAFRQGSWIGSIPARVDIVYHLDTRTWNGEERLQLNVKDIKPANSGWEQE
jgi:single-stranded-DNA-specific exonuclease